ncbi:hypothetical protein RRG08_028601 [Elysia crispata]|uniref:Uncharacterized protein n=1 Tax=Elysia crispata TaxID=231223 RepID=A0AAE1DM69_9GAST|nr:hypothetical protein RRG08_028601 [Elysia crispata]
MSRSFHQAAPDQELGKSLDFHQAAPNQNWISQGLPGSCTSSELGVDNSEDFRQALLYQYRTCQGASVKRHLIGLNLSRGFHQAAPDQEFTMFWSSVRLKHRGFYSH